MRVVHLNYSDVYGGAAIACMRIHEALLEIGIDSGVLVLHSRKHDKGIQTIHDTGYKRLLSTTQFILDRITNKVFVKSGTVPFSTGFFGWDISNHPLIQQADILHLHWIHHNYISLESLKKIVSLKKPVCWTLHDGWVFTGGCHIRNGCMRYMTGCGECPVLFFSHENDLSRKQFLRKKNIFDSFNCTFISPSQWLKETAMESPMLAHHNAVRIPNPVDTTIFKPADKTAARKQLNLPLDKKIIIYGLIHFKTIKHKGLPYISSVAKLLSGKRFFSNDSILFIGLGAKKTKINDTEPFQHIATGYVAKPEIVSLYYSAADLFLAPFLEDNFPNTVLESLSCGTPVVGFAAGGIPEMVTHKENGYLAQTGSAEDLTNGIRWILEDEGKSAALSENARRKVLSEYSFPIIGAEYKRLYNSLGDFTKP
jgi:glycosyltransferase involved in cell wall biosynthesis